MFFVTMNHILEDDRKKDKKALEKERKNAEKERKKAEKERKKAEKAILKLYKLGIGIEELSKDFEMSKEAVEKLVE